METATRRMSNLPRYAGGGFIDGLKRAVGLKEDSPELKAYKERAAAERSKPAAPAAPNAITSYSDGSATAKRMKAVDAMAGGGAIKGKGTGTSDEVPIMASNGEFVIRAAAVEEIGLPALRAINALGGNIPKSPNRNDNKYVEGDIVKDREALIAQIPTGGAGAGPTPQPNPELSASSTELGRNVGNAFNALAPLAGGTALVNGASRLGSALGASTAVGKLATGVSQAMPYVVPAVAAGSLGVAASPATPVATPAAPAPIPAAAKPAAPQPRPGAPNPASGSPDEAMPDGKVNVTRQANGVMSFSGQNITGQPQYTGSAANTMNSGVITAQNQGAMDGIQARQDARDQGARNKMQYDAEVAGAQATNEAGRRMNLEYDLKNGNRNERLAAQAILGSMDATAKDVRGNALTTRGQDITSRGQDLNAAATSQNQKLAQSKDGREAASSAMDQKAKQQLMDAQQEYLNAGDDPVKQKAAERKLMTLGNKQGKAPTFHPGSRIKNVDGSETVTPAYVFDPSTMEAREVGQSGQAALPPGMVKQVGTANGKPVYLDKNGKQVIAKG